MCACALGLCRGKCLTVAAIIFIPPHLTTQRHAHPNTSLQRTTQASFLHRLLPPALRTCRPVSDPRSRHHLLTQQRTVQFCRLARTLLRRQSRIPPVRRLHTRSCSHGIYIVRAKITHPLTYHWSHHLTASAVDGAQIVPINSAKMCR